jgi:hypothetical protein
MPKQNVIDIMVKIGKFDLLEKSSNLTGSNDFGLS